MNKALEIMNAPAAAAGFDIDSFEDTQTCEFRVKHPTTGQPTELVLTLAGPEHPLRKKRQFDRLRRLRREAQRAGKLQLADPVEEEIETDEFLADCVLGWNKLVRNGHNVPYSVAAARELMSDPKRRWLRDQVKGAVEEREAFIASCGEG